MPLTDIAVKSAKPKEKDYKLSDGDGMYLLVTAGGGKRWRLKYRFLGKEKLLALGTYPDISLSEARNKRHEARKQLGHGIDPGAERKALKEVQAQEAAEIKNSFKLVACEWHSKFSGTWSNGHAGTIMDRLTRDVFPWLGDKPICEVEPVDILGVLRRVESRGALETAHRIRTICGQVMRYAVATGRAKRDSAADLRGALPPANAKHHASMTDPKEVAELLRAIDGFKGTFHVKCALQLAPLLFVRPGELRQMEWAELDLDGRMWNIPGVKMKMGQPHIVPLAHQAAEILGQLKPLTGAGRYVFPCHRSPLRPMTNNAVNAALRRMGYTSDEMTGHGFRAMARTILDEVLQVRPDFIEHQLAHAVKDPNGRAYNRTAHLAERRKMMQTWADYLDGLKKGAKVIPMTRATAAE
ncbi:integrase, bacteriophage P4-type [Citrifermentans bemidjiense Bem]|uniref:Integrase, bacteriophage P4-type n=1 Tax=Citrifermentans bemidjiense (strain ATCC BAA-1014 / DSM 16622 / JCM 12645 / Bem) TaxID=404380 RepID=B5E827_CITBB|nr:integrase arm-type DNA-binding domain-containing protein [Citrifermentans bemidjiense]ACH39996.1 integrase, bacteriophage P4-type [Citrifermentans bemidjiense Bem]